MNEFELIRQVVTALGEVTQSPQVALGPGDDAAIVTPTPGWQSVASIDTQIVGQHFPPDAPPALIGYRAVMASVSDLAAMAARPVYMMIALSLDELELDWVMDLVSGIKQAAEQCGITICGGNMGRGPLSLTCSVHGEVPRGEGLMRSGAMAGDVLQVSGPLGGAGACVRTLAYQIGDHLSPAQHSYFKPQARVDLVEGLRGPAHAAIDISDGLLQDLAHLLAASRCGAALDSSMIPVNTCATLEDALHGGEDYELLVAAPKLLDHFTPIGRIVDQPELTLDGKMIHPRGFDHFGN